MRVLILVAVLALSACTNPEEAARVLRSAGYSEISTGDYDWFACGRDDFYATKFSATNPAGQRVSGVVCSGLIIKSSTIRF